MDSIDITAEDLWGNARDDDEEGIDEEIQRREREEDEAEQANEIATEVAEDGAVDDDALASLQNLRKAEAVKRASTRRPRPKLDHLRLIGDRGIPALLDAMKKQKWKGKGHEADDLNRLMMIYEHWGHRMFPKMRFDDIIAKVETLGRKQNLQNFLTRIRQDLPLFTGTTEDDGIIRNYDDDDDVQRQFDDESDDVTGVLTAAFDAQWDQLVNGQTTVENNVDPVVHTTVHQSEDASQITSTSSADTSTSFHTQQIDSFHPDNSTAAQPDPSQIQSTSSVNVSASILSPDVQARIAANRQRALERKRQRQLADMSNSFSQI